jgi:MOSC domain-containing protein YiiM
LFVVTGRVVSVNVGFPREVLWNLRKVSTGIFKEPVAGRVRVRRLGLVGDRQADLTVHGGPEKAVYAYPSEHYHYWRTELNRPLPWGMFGENLTTEGLLEDAVHLGDKLRIGSAAMAVTRPRFPCYKLGIKFGSMNMVRRFQASGRSGFYLSVLEEGEIASGDEIEVISREESNPTISEVFTSEPAEG